MRIILPLIHFWIHHPALFYGISFLLGTSCGLAGSSWLMIPCCSLWLPLLAAATFNRSILKLLSISFITFISAWLYTGAYYSPPVFPTKEIIGTAYVRIKSIRLQPTLFKEQWMYNCEILEFYPNLSTKSILHTTVACRMIFSPEQERPLANKDYWLYGKFTQKKDGSYLLKVLGKENWSVIAGTNSWAEERYRWKQKVREWIENKIEYTNSAHFLAGLATGEFDDYWMKQQFSRFGLQHLLAISGFHFAIIASFLGIALRFLRSIRMQTIILLMTLSSYALFLGPQASILRAWIMCSIQLFGCLFEKQSIGLNSLGCALLVILGYNPLLSLDVGFQLSFCTTTAILLFYPLFQALLKRLSAKRRLSEVIQMNMKNQHAYCLFIFLQNGIALTLAVHVFALPLTLYYFQQFPWNSLLYNLFFPLLATGSLCLLLLSGLLSFMPLLANPLHALNGFYTNFILQFTYQIPTEIDSYLVASFAKGWILFYLCFVGIIGIIIRTKFQTEDMEKNISFI